MNMHVFQRLFSFDEQVTNFAEKCVSEWDIWWIFETSERETKFDIVEKVDIVEH